MVNNTIAFDEGHFDLFDKSVKLVQKIEVVNTNFGTRSKDAETKRHGHMGSKRCAVFSIDSKTASNRHFNKFFCLSGRCSDKADGAKQVL